MVGKPKLKSKTGKIFEYVSGAGTDTLVFQSTTQIQKKDLVELQISNQSEIFSNLATVEKRDVSIKLE